MGLTSWEEFEKELLEELFENTPKALANFSPGLERSDYPGETSSEIPLNPERVRAAHA